MLAVRAGIGFLEKVAPTAVKALGKAGMAEITLAAGIVGGLTNELLDRTVVPMAGKGFKFLKAKVDAKALDTKQDLLEKRAAKLEQKAQKAKEEATKAEVTTEEVKEVAVEEKPKKVSNKKNK